MFHSRSDSRAMALAQWLDHIGLVVDSIRPASSDASFRRYFRVHHQSGCDVAMDAPPDKETTEPFVRIAGLLREAGIHVPAIHQQNRELGFLLLEDLGSTSVLEVLQAGEDVDGVYRAALDSLWRLQSNVDIRSCGLPLYDRPLLQRELGIFHEWFLEKLLGVVLPEGMRLQIDELLIDSALQQPQVCVHRDYHSRNLMWLAGQAPGVIDFQDAVVGPVTYDLVSLLRDCYIGWPRSQVLQWCQSYYQRLFDAGMVEVSFDRFQRWFDLMGLQRHLKAIGIFARLHLRDDKSGYLADIPRTMGYVEAVCREYPELETFSGFLQQQVLPIYQAHL